MNDETNGCKLAAFLSKWWNQWFYTCSFLIDVFIK